MFTILTGSQFGDEGKGKVVDLLAEKYDIVVRFQGGDNAGHTVIVGDRTTSSTSPPAASSSGEAPHRTWRSSEPQSTLVRARALRAEGIRPNIGIDAKTRSSCYHIASTSSGERQEGEDRDDEEGDRLYAYTTSSAARGPDEGPHRPRLLEAKLAEIAPAKEKAISDLGGEPSVVRDPALLGEYLDIGRSLKENVADVSYEINVALDAGKKVLAEGAQGAFLDVIHGTQKFVTSSFTTAGSACANLGVGPARVDHVVGIVKAYMTRVGEGPMPTELKDEVGAHLSKIGKEFGTTTGRPRRCVVVWTRSWRRSRCT
jgi:adenylosuccinate synthase